jgi:antibiotic biosynthesis monooxygenase (ABM) superfamily enzyme
MNVSRLTLKEERPDEIAEAPVAAAESGVVDMAHRWGKLVPRWLLARLATTLAAWLAAFLLVMTLLLLFGDSLQSLPLAVRALVISGVMVVFMANLLMPVLSRAVSRWLAGPPQMRSPIPPKTRSGEESVV